MNDSKIHEIITVCSIGKKKTLDKYIVIASNTSVAISGVPLREGEEIVHAKEMVDYHLVVTNR